jgi:transglutaminase-like putative cysteine protease
MRLRVEHTTTFTYDAPIVEAYTELRLRPLDVGGQRCLSFRLRTEPHGVRVRELADRLGNAVGRFDVLEPHERLKVTATSEVLTAARFDEPAALLSPLERFDYLAPTEYVVLEGAVEDFAAAHAGAGGAAERARSLMRGVREELVYEPGATSVQTPAAGVLALGRGVCQDFAHLFVAACRSEGIPARYVSGYIHDPALGEADGASHAWADVWDDERGWISLDPTHGAEQDESYVRVAVGRDYADVPPTRGVFKGNAQETLEVKVSVRVS